MFLSSMEDNCAIHGPLILLYLTKNGQTERSFRPFYLTRYQNPISGVTTDKDFA